MDLIFTPAELCKYLKISQRTLYRMLACGKLPFAIKVDGSWRFLKKDIDQYIENSKIHAKVLKVLNNCIDDVVNEKPD